MQNLIKISHLYFSVEDKHLINDFSASIQHDDHIGLIGKNGEGKSTLIKLLAGEIKPIKGKVEQFAKVEYIPQLSMKPKQISLYEFLSNITESWWDILQFYKESFVKELDINTSINKLSGGELTKLLFIKALYTKPDLLLLDEPTNHLDSFSLNKLKELLLESKIPFLVVSHNTLFLNSTVDKIWEIEDGRIREFGGNYDFYKLQKQLVRDSILKRREVIQKKLKKVKREIQKEQLKFQRAKSKIKKMAINNDRSIPRVLRNSIKSQGETKHGQNNLKLEKSLGSMHNELASLKLNKRKDIKLESASNNSEGLLISIKEGHIQFGDNEPLLSNINLNIYGGDRIAIMGDNGSGKTTLVNQLKPGSNKLLLGNIIYGKDYEVFSLNQNYENIYSDMSLIENMRCANPYIDIQDLRRILSNLGFHSNFEVVKKAKVLSGGEIARLGFAMALSQGSGILILDEPTNNLDIFTKELIAKSLSEYTGTLVVISHDEQFLKDINITRYFRISNKELIVY